MSGLEVRVINGVEMIVDRTDDGTVTMVPRYADGLDRLTGRKTGRAMTLVGAVSDLVSVAGREYVRYRLEDEGGNPYWVNVFDHGPWSWIADLEVGSRVFAITGLIDGFEHADVIKHMWPFQAAGEVE